MTPNPSSDNVDFARRAFHRADEELTRARAVHEAVGEHVAAAEAAYAAADVAYDKAVADYMRGETRDTEPR